ncbi:MAG: hypothetical protein OEV30_04840 [Ignavibacteria bacterium]|nr:hypothetical protein [Ignavibacteria bacterium]
MARRQNSDPLEGINQVQRKLQSVRRRNNLAVFLQRSAVLIMFYLGGTLVVSLAEHVLNAGTFVRAILFWSLHGSAALYLLISVIPPLLVVLGLRNGESDFETAAGIGRLVPSLKDRLLNALQLVSDADSGRRYSGELVQAAFEDVLKVVDESDLNSTTDFRPSRVKAALAGGTALLTIGLFLLSSGALPEALNRVWSYGTEFTIPPPFRLVLEPGDTEVLKGKPVTFVVRIEGESPDPVQLFARPESQERFELLELRNERRGVYRHQIGTAARSLVYYARSGDAETEQYRLTVLNPPLIRSMRLTVSPPAYSGLAEREQEDHHGDVSGLPGTRITYRIESSKELSTAEIVFDDSTRHSLDVAGARASGTIRTTRTTGYTLSLVDREGLKNRDPVHYSIKVVPDEHPRVVIEIPGTDINVAGNEDLQLLIRASDDYGITRVRLGYRLIASRYEQPSEVDRFSDILLPADFKSNGLLPHIWSLGELSLVPEDVVSYYVEVYDNDVILGPKLTRSDPYTLRLPSMEEVFAQVDEHHESGFEKLKEALTEADEARRNVEQLQEELRKKQQQADWQERQRAEELMERYRNIQESLSETAELVDQMIEEMKRSSLLSPETLEKYQQLQELLAEMNSPELQEALRRLQESFRQPDPEEVLAAMEKMNLTEEQFRKSIERTMNLLKRVQIEQKVEEAIRRMEEMLAQQEELRASAEEANDANDRNAAEEAAREQQDLAGRMEQMDPLLESLEQMMSEFPNEMPLEALEDAQAQFDSSAMAERMEELSEQLRNMELEQAMSGQQQMSSSMQQIADQLRQMQQMMQANQQQEIVNDFREIYQDLLELSQRQEQMKNETHGLERNSPLFREGLAGQMEALQNLGSVTERLAAVSQKTFGVTPEMGESIGEAMANMSAAMEALGQRNSQGAAHSQEGAMGALNEAAQQVQSSLQAMMQGGGEGMGMAGMMQRLQGMSAMQRGINQGTRNMGSLGQQEAAAMARLAGEQGRARKSLEQLAREASRAGELSKLLGDLNKTAQEMREVQTDLAQGSIRPETLRKQERILSRLLDSQRSLQERDYEQKRKAETARGYERDRLPGTDLSSVQAKEQLRQDLLRAMEQGYSSDYQAIIRNYFELLEKTEPGD